MILSLKKQVVSLELAKQLKEAGYKQKGYFYWIKPTGKNRKYILINKDTYGFCLDKTCNHQPIVTPTIAELLNQLPCRIEKNQCGYWLMIESYTQSFLVYYICSQRLCETQDILLSNALAKMWLYLKKEKIK